MVDEIRIWEQISGAITMILGIIGTILGPVEIIYTIFDIPKITVKNVIENIYLEFYRLSSE